MVTKGAFDVTQQDGGGWGHIAHGCLWLVGAARVAYLFRQPTTLQVPPSLFTGSAVHLERIDFDGDDESLDEAGGLTVTEFAKHTLQAAAVTLPASAGCRARVEVHFSAEGNEVAVRHTGSADRDAINRLSAAVAKFPPVPADGITLDIWLRVDG